MHWYVKGRASSRAGRIAVLAAAAVLLGLHALHAAGANDEIEQRYFEGLRTRGLYRLTETYCLGRLADDHLDLAQRARLSVELSRTFAEHAAVSSADQSVVLWEQARKVADEFLSAHPQYDGALLVKLQLAEVDLAEGEEGRWRWEASPQDAELAATSRAILQRALRAFGDLAASVDAALRDPQAGQRTAEFSRYRLRGLGDTIRYRQAKAWLNLARLAKPGSADAVDALAQASERLKPLADALEDGPLQWNSRIELVECYRLQGDRERAMRRLEKIEESTPPEAILHRAYAARARILLAEGQADRAADGLRAYRQLLGAPNGELDLAYTEALLHQWKQAAQRRDEAEAQRDRQQVTELLAQVRQRSGGYWSRRCELLLAGHLRESRFGADSKLLAESAERMYRFGQTDEALELYRRAAAQADDEGRVDKAFELGFTQGGILLRRGQWEAAAEQFTTLASQANPRAGQADLLAAYARGRLYTAAPSPQRLEAYQAALQRHLKRFTGEPTADEAQWMYGRLCESRERPEDAIEHYAAVRPGQPRYPAAVLAAGRCYDVLLGDNKRRGTDRENLLVAAEQFLRGAAQVPSTGESLSVAALASAVRLARLWVEREPPRYAEAKELLAAFLKAVAAAAPGLDSATAQASATNAGEKRAFTDDSLAQWYAAARQWYVLVLAALGEVDAAQEQLAALSASRPAELLELIEGLSELAAETTEQLRGHLGKLQLQAARLLEPQRASLSPEQQFRLDVLSAHAMAYSGQPRRALDHFNELARRDPDNVALKEARAELLLLVDEPAAYQESLALWRDIEQKARTATPRWYRAKYSIALCHFRLDDRDQCRKVIEVTRLLHPELGGATMRKRFLALLEQCSGSE